ncbi:MAG: hypothetical protein OYG32_14745 [Rhodospirillaceae bacterium]|nr:hypothetical protein [Rhodospirillaceae bacterium]
MWVAVQTAAPPVAAAPPPTPALALASDAAIRVLASSLRSLADRRQGPAESANACEPAAAASGGWAWIWTARDAAGRPLAALRSPDGVAVEVREGEILSDGATVLSITAGGVSASSASGGPAAPLPRDAGEPRGGGEEEADAGALDIPPGILERMRGG